MNDQQKTAAIAIAEKMRCKYGEDVAHLAAVTGQADHALSALIRCGVSAAIVQSMGRACIALTTMLVSARVQSEEEAVAYSMKVAECRKEFDARLRELQAEAEADAENAKPIPANVIDLAAAAVAKAAAKDGTKPPEAA